MKKIGALVLAFLMMAGLLAGCGSVRVDSVDEDKEDKLLVYTSFYPMYDYAKRVGRDKIELVNLVPAGTEPHHWEPEPKDISGLEKADLFFYNGVSMEHWVDKVLSSLGQGGPVAVDTSQGLGLIDKSHTHEEEGEEHEEEEGENSHDPHVWLSVVRARQQMENVKNALVQADSKNKEYYEQNYEQAAALFDGLDAEFSQTLSPLSGKQIVVAHQAFGYLCADYGLAQVPIEGVEPDSEPDPTRMAQIIRFVQEQGVKVIFFETLASPKVAETIARATGARTGVLDPLEGISEEGLKAGEDYVSVMRRNLQALKEALQ